MLAFEQTARIINGIRDSGEQVLTDLKISGAVKRREDEWIEVQVDRRR